MKPYGALWNPTEPCGTFNKVNNDNAHANDTNNKNDNEIYNGNDNGNVRIFFLDIGVEKGGGP